MNEGNNGHIAGKKAIAEYDMLRVIVTLLVIIGHSTYYSIVTPYGGCDYANLTFPGLSVFYRLMGYGIALINLFHMPLYMALSGALYRVKKRGGGYDSYKSIVEDKAKKLLIPFIVVTLFFSVPLKFASGYFNSCDYVLRDIAFGQVLMQGNTHLWFLPVLFVIFLVVYLIEKVGRSRKITMLCAFVLSCVSGIIPTAILRNVAYYFLWFYVGYCFENKWERLNEKLDRQPNVLIITIVFFLSMGILKKLISDLSGISGEYSMFEKLLQYICSVAGCLSVYSLSYVLSRTRLTTRRIFKVLRSNSLGLYLYSDTWNYVVLRIAVGHFGSAVFVTNIGSALLIFGRIIITFTLALIISTILKTLKIKYIC